MLTRLAALALLMLTMAGCGSGSPSAPSSTTTTATFTGPVNVTGTWREGTGGSLVLTLQQDGTAVTGTSTFVDRNLVFGTYTGDGTVAGTVNGTTMTLAEVYRIRPDDGTDRSDCRENVSSTATLVAADRMNGTFSQTDVCGGQQVFAKSGTFMLTKQ